MMCSGTQMEIPYKTSEESSGSSSSFSNEFVAIKMPLTPSPTPTHKKVNFLVTSRSVDAAPIVDSDSNNLGNLTTRGKSSSARSIMPKLNFPYNRTSSSDVEKAISLAPESPCEKPSVSGSGSVSLSKLFAPKIYRTSSLPVEEIGRVNNEFAFGGCLGASPYVRLLTYNINFEIVVILSFD